MDMSFIIAFNTVLGNILRMMCRNVLKIMLEDPVQHYTEDVLEDDFDHYVQDKGQDECVMYVAHVL